MSVLRGAISLLTLPVRRANAEKWRRAHVEGLSELPPEEGYILLWAVAQGRQVVALEYFDERVKALTAKRYLQLIPGNHHMNKVPHLIPDHIWKELKKEQIPAREREQLRASDPFSRW